MKQESKLALVDESQSVKGERRLVMSYKMYEKMNALTMAVFVIGRCGLKAVVEFEKKGDADHLALYVESVSPVSETERA